MTQVKVPPSAVDSPDSDPKPALTTLDDVCDLPEDALAKFDIARLNLLCASGLPGAGTLNLDHYSDWIEDAAQKVKLETDRNYYKFIESPALFGYSQARFCVLCLVTVLQRQCGVKYNPKWINLKPEVKTPKEFGMDARDVFIHAIVDGIGGTCGSLPVLYAAVGRRLDYPLAIVKAAQHLFLRWDDPEGRHWLQPERFNIEATGPGVHFLPDDHYRTWPHKISEEDIEAGIYLRSLSRREELAEFLATRAHCRCAHGFIADAVSAMSKAAQLAPNNRHFAASVFSLKLHLQIRRRRHVFLNAPIPGANNDLPDGPFWIGLPGQEILVQIPKRGYSSSRLNHDCRVVLSRQFVQLPDGQHAEADVPLHGSGPLMTAHWLKLENGEFALVHKLVRDSLSRPVQSEPLESLGRRGHPILPETATGGFPKCDPALGLPELGFTIYERQLVLDEIHRIADKHRIDRDSAGLPYLQPLAIPPGPAQPHICGTSGTEIHFS